jgi:Na+/melibiose symporter-like transporter
MAGLMAAFVSPLTGPIIKRFELVPTMRVLYLFAAVMMTSKAFVTNALVTETQQGQVRMRETQGQPLLAVLRGTPQILKQILRSPITLVTGGLIVVMGVYRVVHGTFWSILVTQKLQVPAQYLALYPFARSITTLLFFFLGMPRLRRLDTRTPLLLGLLGLILSQAILIFIPAGSYLLLLLVTIVEGCSLPMASTHIEKLVVVTVDAQERARIMAILYTVVLVFTSPFGWIAGRISEVDRSLPFALLLATLVVGVGLTYLGSRMARAKAPVPATVEQPT